MGGNNHYGIEAIWLIYPSQENSSFRFYEPAGKWGDFPLLHLLKYVKVRNSATRFTIFDTLNVYIASR